MISSSLRLSMLQRKFGFDAKTTFVAAQNLGKIRSETFRLTPPPPDDDIWKRPAPDFRPQVTCACEIDFQSYRKCNECFLLDPMYVFCTQNNAVPCSFYNKIAERKGYILFRGMHLKWYSHKFRAVVQDMH